jgi:hypothetical protein
MNLVTAAAFLLVAKAQGPVSVTGSVSNEAARPIQHALVILDPGGTSRQLRTDRDGRFSFAGVSAGPHTIRVTWVGFAPEERRIEVVGSSVNVEVTLHRLTRLDTTIVTARRTGIYGSVISIDSLLPIPGARVEIIGDRRADSTNSSGAFNFPDVKHGSYIVRIKHPQFDSRNFSVVVPVEGGTELDVVMERGRVSRDAHMEMLYREMDTRLQMRGTNSAFITREALKGRDAMNLDAALQFVPEFAKKAFIIQSDVCVFVDGIPRPHATLRDFAPEEIESVELYGGTWRSILTNLQREAGRMDPTGSILLRWPAAMNVNEDRSPCGLPLTPGEAAISPQVVKVKFALVWLRR